MVVVVFALLTVCPPLNVPLLALKLASPAYSAVTTCVPTDKEDVAELVATPPARAIGLPKLLPSTLNCTLPLGVPPVPVTVAVNVTGWPKTEGFAEELTEVAELTFPL